MAALQGILLFHLNLLYSSIEEEQRGQVVDRCYRPLLGLLESRPWLRLCVEASGHTLELAARLDPGWLELLKRLVGEGRVELIGSGDTQLIGPLVPAAVNRWNQRLGQESYQRLVGLRPGTALVNEMAWSQGLVDSYLDAGYGTLLMEWNNPRANHPEWDNEWRYGFARTRSPRGRSIEVCWIDTTAFQKFQRAVALEIELDEYRAFVAGHHTGEPRHLFLYASDGEIFDWRPGRYATEPALNGGGEWDRIGAIIDALHADGVPFTTPRALPRTACAPEVVLTSAADPIPVKKQPKYNVTRWALSGWDDVGWNARCFGRARVLTREGGGAEDWRVLCRAWASDLRTHLTEKRRVSTERRFTEFPFTDRGNSSASHPPLVRARCERRGRRIELETDEIELVLNTQRGLAIESARFHGRTEPLFGTLQHGTFDPIQWTADFYSGHTVVEMPGEGRVTDLAPVEPVIERLDDALVVSTDVPTGLGPLPQRIALRSNSIELAYRFSAWGERPLASLRTAILTLNPRVVGPGLCVTTENGGEPEVHEIVPLVDHGRGVSPLATASGAFGATGGRLALARGDWALELTWPHEQCAALPLMTCVEVDGLWLVRLSFSLGEVDDTFRAGAPLRDFALTIRGIQ